MCGNSGAFTLTRASSSSVANVVTPELALSPLPFELSADQDLFNQATAVKHFEELFYQENRNYLTNAELAQVH